MQPEGDGAVPESSLGGANEQAPTISKPSRCPHGTGSPDPSALRQAGLCDPQQPHPKCRVEPHRRSLERARLVDRPSVTAANLLALSQDLSRDRQTFFSRGKTFVKTLTQAVCPQPSELGFTEPLRFREVRRTNPASRRNRPKRSSRAWRACPGGRSRVPFGSLLAPAPSDERTLARPGSTRPGHVLHLLSVGRPRGARTCTPEAVPSRSPVAMVDQ
jgi:hypothetical protein